MGDLVPLTIGAVALGSLFGALEVATVAFADDAGRKAISGLMLGAFALGSLLAGVVAGVVTWQRGPLRRAQIGMGLLAVGTVFLPFLAGPGGRHGGAVPDRPDARADADRAVLPDRVDRAPLAAQRGDGVRADGDQRGHRPRCLAGGGGRGRARRVGRVLEVTVSAVLAALSGILIRDSGQAEENASDAAHATEG